MPQHHNIDEAKATWKASRRDAFAWWRKYDYRGPFNGTPPLPDDFWLSVPIGPTDPVSNIYPFTIERTEWRKGSDWWHEYVIKWDGNIIERGTM